MWVLFFITVIGEGKVTGLLTSDIEVTHLFLAVEA